MTSANYLRTSQLAKMVHLHPNTIRLYECLGYLSPAKRNKHNYRCFTELHVLQLKICRCIYSHPFFNGKIRAVGNHIMISSGKQDWMLAKLYTQEYLAVITAEITLAQSTAVLLQDWAEQQSSSIENKPQMISRKQAADYLGVTVETIRNWERNQLICSSLAAPSERKLYSMKMVEKMQVIYAASSRL